MKLALTILVPLALILLFALIPTTIIYFAWKLIAVGIFGAPFIPFLYVFLGYVAIRSLIAVTVQNKD